MSETNCPVIRSPGVTVRIGNRQLTIETSNPDSMRQKLVEVAGVVAGGIEASLARSDDLNVTYTVERALEIAAEIMIAVRP